MAPPPELVRLVDTYAAQVRQVRAATLSVVTNSWQSLDAYRDADVARWAATVAPTLEGAQQRTAALTDAYLSRFTTIVTGEPTQPAGITADMVTSEALRGVSAEELLARTGPTVWTSLSKGDSLDWAARQGLNRATKAAETNLQLAKTHTAVEAMSADDRIVGHRRVLTGATNCALCLVAASQRYTKEDLQPIHPGCDCGVQPIYGKGDPGQVIDVFAKDAPGAEARRVGSVEEVHALIEERFGSATLSARDFTTAKGEALAYRDVLVIHNHGEIGPVLGVRGQQFTGPGDLA